MISGESTTKPLSLTPSYRIQPVYYSLKFVVYEVDDICLYTPFLHACSAVNAENLAVDPLAVLGCEEADDTGDINREIDTVERRPGGRRWGSATAGESSRGPLTGLKGTAVNSFG